MNLYAGQTIKQLAKKYWGVENPTKSDIRKASKVNQGIRARLIREGKFTPKYLTPQSAAEEGHKRSQLKEREARKYLGKQDKAIAKTQKQYDFVENPRYRPGRSTG